MFLLLHNAAASPCYHKGTLSATRVQFSIKHEELGWFRDLCQAVSHRYLFNPQEQYRLYRGAYKCNRSESADLNAARVDSLGPHISDLNEQNLR